MKDFIWLAFVIVLFSCDKTATDNAVQPDPQTGTLTGNIKAYDRYGNDNVDYNDVSIKLIDKKKNVVSGVVQSNGKFVFDNVLLGNVVLAVSKPGYGFTDSVVYSHLKSSDTLSSIFLIEELPFSCKLNSAVYGNSFFTISCSYNFRSTDNYLVTGFLCFSKDPQVSLNYTNLLWSPASQTNVQYITGSLGGSSSMPFSTLTNAGFREGDIIYVTMISSIARFWTAYYDENRNYEILHYKNGSSSNVVSFTLKQ